MDPVSNSTTHVAFDGSKPYFPAWSLALFVLFGITAVGLLFCVHHRGKGNSYSNDPDRENISGWGTDTSAVNGRNDQKMEGP
jgi:hypothetical protein